MGIFCWCIYLVQSCFKRVGVVDGGGEEEEEEEDMTVGLLPKISTFTIQYYTAK